MAVLHCLIQLILSPIKQCTIFTIIYNIIYIMKKMKHNIIIKLLST